MCRVCVCVCVCIYMLQTVSSLPTTRINNDEVL